MAANRSKPSPIYTSAVPPPPRTLNVQKFAEARALELESLHEIVATRLGHGFRIQRGKRRRTTGHLVAKNRRRKRRKMGDGGEPEDGVKMVSRRARRSAELQQNPLTEFCVSGDGMKRLRTHLWHAKRFTMVKLWGFYLPLGLQGRGRGSRSILKCLKSGTLVHDASYCSPVQLDGPEDSILSVLKMIVLPSLSDDWKKLYKPIAYGVCYGNAMLCHVGTHPSRLIAPVMYMWRPFDRGNSQICVKQDHISDCCSMHDENGHYSLSSRRQLWIWIHAAAFNEGFDALRSACQKLMDETGISVSCSSPVGRLGKLEVIGSKANQVIKKLLHPVPESMWWIMWRRHSLQLMKNRKIHMDKDQLMTKQQYLRMLFINRQERGSSSTAGSSSKDALLAACEAHETLPRSAEFPAYVFTTCLTTPIKMALRWSIL